MQRVNHPHARLLRADGRGKCIRITPHRYRHAYVAGIRLGPAQVRADAAEVERLRLARYFQ